MRGEEANTNEPVDLGGRRARIGFLYQDLCALRYCVAAATEGVWDEVCCESHGDIVLKRGTADAQRQRFVEVKYRGSARRHWSIAQLCEAPTTGARNKGRLGDSILCALFRRGANDKKAEYRLAVNEGVDAQLSALLYKWGEPDACPGLPNAEIDALLTRLASWTPPTGRAVEEFVGAFAIEQHSADIADMESRILGELDGLLQSEGFQLLRGIVELVFDDLYLVVFRAASLGRTDGGQERIRADDFRQLAVQLATRRREEVAAAISTEPAVLLRQQLQAIHAREDSIANAQRLRRAFVSAWREHPDTALRRALDAALVDVRRISVEERLRAADDPTMSGRKLLLNIMHRLDELARFKIDGVTDDLLKGICFFLVARGQVRLT